MPELKFGVYLFAHRLTSPQAVLDIAIAAEALGFDSLWVGERVFYPGKAPPDAPIDFEPLTVLSYVAARTSRIRLGTSTLILPYRHPLLVAKAVATLDQLSGGRVILGVAAGWLEAEFAALGVPFGDRGAICDEYIAALRELWTGDEPRFEGRFCSFGPLTFSPRPVQQPHPPIWIAGDSDRALRRAVELGDGWQPELGFEEMERAAQRFHQLARARGRVPPPLLAVGRRLGLTWDELGPEREPVHGRPEQIALDLRRYHQMGVCHFVFGIYHPTVGEVVQDMERFATQVKPLIAGP